MKQCQQKQISAENSKLDKENEKKSVCFFPASLLEAVIFSNASFLVYMYFTPYRG